MSRSGSPSTTTAGDEAIHNRLCGSHSASAHATATVVARPRSAHATPQPADFSRGVQPRIRPNPAERARIGAAYHGRRSPPPALPSPAMPLQIPERRLPLILGALAALLAAAVFLPASRGEFVYDDEQLILSNALIQDPRLAWTALTSDVFAYRAAAGEATSPYWRPTTIA